MKTAIVLACFLIASAVPHGATAPYIWSILTGAMVIFFALSNQEDSKGLLPRSRPFRVGIGVTLGWMALQSVPIPSFLLSTISPVRSQLCRNIAAIFSMPPDPLCMTVSYAPLETIAWIAWLIGLGCVFWMATQCSEDNRRVFLYSLLIFCFLEALYGIAQVADPDITALGSDQHRGWARGTFVNKNHYAAFLALFVPSFLALILDSWRREKNAAKLTVCAIAVALIVLAIIGSQSRGGMVSALIGVLTFIMLASRSIEVRVVRTPLVVITVVLIFYSIFLLRQVLDLFVRFSEAGSDLDNRLAVWKDGLAVLKDHILGGVGWGAYPFVEDLYRVNLMDITRASHIHNDYLEWTVELGVPVGLIFTALVLGSFISAFRLGVKNPSDFTVVGAVAGMLGVLVLALWDFPLHIPSIVLGYVSLLGFSHAKSKVFASKIATDCVKSLKKS